MALLLASPVVSYFHAHFATESASFGRVLMIPVGAAGVGSIVYSCGEGDDLSAGTQHGYFEYCCSYL